MEEGCKCQLCGSNYDFDIIVIDDIWEKIKPEGKAIGAGLLCPACIINRVKDITTGAYLVSIDDSEMRMLIKNKNNKLNNADKEEMTFISESIFADFTICKLASDIGLRPITEFSWCLMSTGEYRALSNFEIEIRKFEKEAMLQNDPDYIYLDKVLFPAPTSEEVPLPVCFNELYITKTSVWWEGVEITNIPNEATARMKMAIWLITSIEEIKKWYIDNEFL